MPAPEPPESAPPPAAAASAAPAAPAALPRRAPLARRRSGRLVAGVAGGIADHLGIDVFWVRGAFALLAALSGAGVMAYVLCWVFIRLEPADVVRGVSRRERQQALGLAALGVGLAIAGSAFGGTLFGWIIGPLGVAAVGAAVVWREADDSRRRRWAAGARAGVSGGGWKTIARVSAGVIFVAAGIAVFLVGSVNLGQVQFTLLAVLATLIGVGVLTVPWWVRLVQELGEERRERIRSAERAEIAAHLHDSVLQTLALIQKQAEQPREVRRLARGQERELRGWLHGPTGYGPRTEVDGTAAAPGTLAEAITTAAAEVEDTYAVTVRPVVVGDCPMDEQLNALVAASREAMVNAAKHAGVAEVSLYVEVEADAVSVFVRDRGVGFEPDQVPADRHGLQNSVHGRMDRYGGSVKLRSASGEGTEVQLEMPRQPQKVRESGP